MAQAELDRLWMSFDEVARPEEKGSAISSIVGLQCGDRAITTFRTEQTSGVRDAVVLYDDYIVMVNTPRSLSVGTLLDTLRKQSPRGSIQHARVPLDEITCLEVTWDAPPGWRLAGARFLHLEVARGYVWFWIDDEVMSGRKQGDLEKALAHWQARGVCQTASSQAARPGSPGGTVPPRFCSRCGAAARGGRFCGACGVELE
jgi:hypothetical protein